MAGNGNGRESGSWSKARPHDEYLELCALSTTGELSDDEQRRLREHLAGCAECRNALKEFEAATELGAPLVAAALAESSQSPAEAAAASEASRLPPTALAGAHRVAGANEEADARSGGPQYRAADRDGHSSHVNWSLAWMPFAAAIMLAVALGMYSYQAGKHHDARDVESATAAVTGKLTVLEQRLSDAGHERELLATQLAKRDGAMRDLQRQLQTETTELADARNEEGRLEAALQSAVDNGQQLAQQRSSAARALSAAENSLERTRAELASLEQERQREQGTAGSLEAQIEDLNGELRRAQETVNQQQDLLADDRDIRNLMGARDLYIAEVYDVGRDGATRKPYGRVFYTKGKSLIFYAYDLDDQPGVKRASIFQAWGQNGPDRRQALDLGIFYEDSVAQRRWMLKFDNPKALEQINAVFVTVEPRGGSRKPSGKPLLFASLRIEPNHP